MNHELANQRFTCKHEFANLALAYAITVRAEEIVKFRRVVGSGWLEYIYNV